MPTCPLIRQFNRWRNSALRVKMKTFILVFIPLCLQFELSRAFATDPCRLVRCGRCQECRLNKLGQPECVQTSDTCCPTGNVVNCLVNPCRNQAIDCPAADSCVASYCGGCNAIYYDKHRNKISGQQCAERDPCANVNCGPCKTCIPQTILCKKAPCPQFSCQEVAGEPDARCLLPKNEGFIPVARAPDYRFFFDSRSGQCREFPYYGPNWKEDPNNENNFLSVGDCETACLKTNSECQQDDPCASTSCEEGTMCSAVDGRGICIPSHCFLKPKTGPCEALMPRFYFNPSAGRCQRFFYGGCAGNSNRFNSIQECNRACLQRSDCAPKSESPMVGCEYLEIGKDANGCPEYWLACS